MKFLQNSISEIKLQLSSLWRLALGLILFMLVSYSLYFILNEEAVIMIGFEDGPYEYLTAVLFLIASIFFIRTYLWKRNIFFLLLAIVFFVGCGEEISWGQRILNFGTPEFMSEINVQDEVTLHNIEWFNGHDFEHNQKKGWAKLLSINFLYKLFWLGFGVIIPLAILLWSPLKKFALKIGFPVAPLVLGVLFPMNWVVFKIIKVFFSPANRSFEFYYTLGEISECISAAIFLTLGLYFFQMARKERNLETFNIAHAEGINAQQ